MFTFRSREAWERGYTWTSTLDGIPEAYDVVMVMIGTLKATRTIKGEIRLVIYALNRCFTLLKNKHFCTHKCTALQFAQVQLEVINTGDNWRDTRAGLCQLCVASN